MKIGVLLIMAAALSLQSCFEIREVVTFREDGSGSFRLSIDLSQVKQMMQGFGQQENSEEGSPFQNMEAEYEKTREKLAVVDGISGMKFISENDGYVVTTGFDFSDVSALNKGMDVVSENASGSGEIPEYYKFNKRSFERTASHNFIDLVKNEFAGNNMGVEGMDLSTLFSDVAYVNQIHFEEKTVRRVRSGNVEVSEDGSTVTNRYLIFNENAAQSLEFKLKVK
jgi:hypothetical protein